MVKLTKRQLEVLKILAKEGNYITEQGDNCTLYDDGHDIRIKPKTVIALWCMKLIYRTRMVIRQSEDFDIYRLEITKEGILYNENLKSSDKKLQRD